MLAGCGGQSNQTPTQSGSGGSSGGSGSDSGSDTTAQPKQKVLKFADVGTAENLDPQALNPRSDVNFLSLPGNAYETLVGFDPTSGGEVVPWLATKIPTADNGLVSEDGTTYEFPLKKGVKFHTGGEMLAEDVKFSVERAMTLGLSPAVGTITRTLAKDKPVEVVDDYRVRFNLSSPYPPFLRTVIPITPMGVISKKAVMEHGGKPTSGQPNRWVSENTAGTGPFKVGKWKRGNFLEWLAFEDYRNDEFPKADKVVQNAVPELSTRLATLQKGDAHIIEASAEALSEVKGTPNVEITFTGSYDPAHISFNFEIPYDSSKCAGSDTDTVPPDFFQDNNIRKAFGYAMNHKVYIEEVWNGHAQRMNQYQLPNTFAYDPDAKQYERDPAKAEELFKKAGYWDQKWTVTLLNEDIPEFTQGALILKDSIESLNSNFTVRVQSVPEAVFAQKAGGAERYYYPLSFGGFLGQGPDPAPYYADLFLEGGSVAKRARAPDHLPTELKDKIKAANNETDRNRRKQLYTELQNGLAFDHPVALGVSVEDKVAVHHKCMKVTRKDINPAWRRFHMKHYSVDSCSLS